MNHFIFLTTEGHTFQPGSESPEPDIENCQLIGQASGTTARKAFRSLLEENPCLTGTSFDEVFCYRLHDDYQDSKEFFYLSDRRTPEDDQER